MLADLRGSLFEQLRRPGAYVGAGFVLVAAAIFANALFMQPRRHPAPLFVHEAPPPQPKADPLVHAVQEALAAARYYSGPIDGLAGPQTHAAIAAFQTATGREATGAATPDLLAAVVAASASRQVSEMTTGSAPAMPEQATSSGEAASVAGVQDIAPAKSDPLVASVQEALSVSAYGPLTADGVVGPETRAAIMRFQRDHNLPVTGEVSEGLVVELRAAGAMYDGG